MLSLKVINIWGAPGVGKSTIAAGLFNAMKLKGHSVELVSEVAKDHTWEKHWLRLAHQPSVAAEQDWRLYRLKDQVEWVITDSPLPMQIAYQGDEWVRAGLDKFTWDLYGRYENYNVLLQRNPSTPYETIGRNQNLEEAMVLDNIIDNLFHTAILDDEAFCLELMSSFKAPQAIYEWLMANEYGE